MKRKAGLLLAVALYTFLGIPVTPAWAQEAKDKDRPVLPDQAENPGAGSSDMATGNQSWDALTGGLTLLGKGVAAYEMGQYSVALDYLNQGLAQGGNSKEELATLHKYKALVLLAQNQPEAAKVEFAEALKLNPAMSLDPEVHSPREIEAFQRAKSELPARGPSKDQSPPITQNLRLVGNVVLGRSVEVRASVHDNVGVSRVDLLYRNTGDVGFGSVPLRDMGNGEYAGVLPGDWVKGRELEYYLVAQDAAGNVSSAGTVKEPNRVAVAANPPDKPWYKKWWVWGIVAGVAAAGIGAGVAAGGGGGGGGNGSQKTADVTVVVPPP